MKTLLFATMYLPEEASLARYRQYLRIFRNNYYDMGISKLIFLDDGSNPWRLKNMGLPLFIADEADPFPDRLPEVSIFTFMSHLGRPAFRDFQGWWRSFKFVPLLAEHYFDKIIHIESDAWVRSERLKQHLTSLTSGWTVLWCPHYGMPESAIQVIGKDQFEAMKEVVPRTDIDPERYLPFTCVNQDFKGDRYTEYDAEIPEDADYACQIGLI